MLFEKCERATALACNGTISDSFDDDILNFVRQKEQKGEPFFVDDADIDGLVQFPYSHCCS